MTRKRKSSGPLPEQHARVLAQRLLDDQLVLVAGAGLSHLAPAKDKSDRRLPLWSALGQQVGEICGEDPADYDGDVLDLFDGVAYGQSRGDLERAVRKALPDGEFELSAAHRALGPLPWHAIVSTNYDGLLARLTGQTPVVREEHYERRRVPTDEQPRLYQIHGDLDDPHTLTREDYQLWDEKHPLAFSHLKQLLLDKTALLVGYSLSDPHLRTLLATIRKITEGREKRLHGWFWEIDDQKVKLLDRRDKIEAIRIDQEKQWTAAFEQVAGELEQLRALKAAEVPDTVASPPKTTTTDDRYAREQYSRAVQAHYGAAILRGFQLSGTGFAQEQVPLLDVFVEPDLVRHRAEDLAELMEDPESDEPEFAVPLAGLGQAVRERRRRLREATGGTRESALQLLDQESQVLIVGDPGQGKSTLLRRYLLASVERWLDAPGEAPVPIYLRLAEWTGIEGPAEGRLAHAARERLPRLGEVPSDAVERWLGGPVLWLLDGIDEIRDPAERGKLQGEIAARSRLHPEDQWVVSTRPAGEPSGGLGGFERTELPNLTDEQVKTVLEKWATLKARSGEDSYKPAELAESLQGSIALSEVAHNALFLTLIVLFYIRQRRLPHDRWEFYREAVTLLSDSWARNRSDCAGDEIPRRYLDSLLERLSFEGMMNEQVVWTRAELAAAVEVVLRQKNYSGEGLDREVERFLAAAEDLIGILVEQGPDRFGFLHLTFQEYFAARALDNRSGEAREVIARFWDHPDWGEVWSLYTLSIQKDPARLDQLFRTIMEQRHSLDELLCRERLTCLRLIGVVQATLPELANEILEWGWLKIRSNDTHDDLPDSIANILNDWERSIPREEILAMLAHERVKLRASGVQGSRDAVSDLSVREALLERLRDDSKWQIRSSAIGALAPVADQACVRDALLRSLHDSDQSVRLSAMKILIHFADQTPVREVLLQILHDGDGTRVQIFAMHALAFVADRTAVRDDLRQRLCENEWQVQAGLFSSLALILVPDFRDALLKKLSNCKWRVRYTAVRVLAPTAAEPPIRDALLKRLQDSAGQVRTSAIEALARVADQTSVRDAILKMFRDDEGVVRRSAVEALAGLADQISVRDALLEMLHDDEGVVRCSTVVALAGLVDQISVRDALLEMLHDDEGVVRCSTVAALAGNVDNPRIHDALIQALQDGDEAVRRNAVEALSHVADQTLVQNALLQSFQDDSGWVRSCAVDALSRVADRTLVQDALLHRLQDDEWQVRFRAVDALSRVADRTPVQNALLQRLQDDQGEVRDKAVDALSRVANKTPVLDAVLRKLEDVEWLIRSRAIEVLAPFADQAPLQDALVKQWSIEPDSRVRAEIRRALAPVIAKERRAALGPLPTPLL